MCHSMRVMSFWHGNPPNDYLLANNLTDTAGNGPFREVVVTLDGNVIGAIWPFTVVYTGGINPLLRRPISGIGSFDLPSYDIEITPFLGNMLDGKTHTLQFRFSNALKCVGLNGTFLTKANRSISSTGWVKASHGKIMTKAIQKFCYSDSMVMGDNGNVQMVNQEIHFDDSVQVKKAYTFSKAKKSSNVTLGFNEKKFGVRGAGFKMPVSFVENLQNGQGIMVVKNNLVASGVRSTQQNYKYEGNKFCYLRNIILNDVYKSGFFCVVNCNPILLASTLQ
ncbi:hypothetical protein SLEP1_g25717 [Rubroshorea leprosula]|uniref:Peptide N-acetyl-beta-D-glucosaminyl asparaginase amidase A N-terminal domain-containing protein n=1 Tax=Rubroshorea leprosula TaxID=152421 RepID=A0AAV5JS31_9ROSI|nr:hypothetical protein SLEP1_g25717 [Rubroshorea leprosula]